jgi:hypothetical protein
LLKQLTSNFDTDPFDGTCRRCARRLPIMANEAALTHGGDIGKRGYSQLAPDIVSNPGMELFKARIAMLQGEGRTKLRLAAWTFEKNHKLTGNGQGYAWAEIRFDQSQREIDTGGDPGRRPNIAVPNEDWVRIKLYRREYAGELSASSPMCDGAAAIKKAGRRQEKGTAAHGRGTPSELSARVDPANECSVRARGSDAKSARHHEGIEGRAGLGKALRRKAKSARAGYERLLGDNGEFVRAWPARGAGEFVRTGENLQWASHVKKLDVLESQNLDPQGTVWRKTRGLWHLRQSMPP